MLIVNALVEYNLLFKFFLTCYELITFLEKAMRNIHSIYNIFYNIFKQYYNQKY